MELNLSCSRIGRRQSTEQLHVLFESNLQEVTYLAWITTYLTNKCYEMAFKLERSFMYYINCQHCNIVALRGITAADWTMRDGKYKSLHKMTHLPKLYTIGIDVTNFMINVTESTKTQTIYFINLSQSFPLQCQPAVPSSLRHVEMGCEVGKLKRHRGNIPPCSRLDWFGKRNFSGIFSEFGRCLPINLQKAKTTSCGE